MSSASCSIETPALIRRTFDWDSTSLLKGMSRDELRTILQTGCDIIFLRDGPAGRLSLDLQTRHENSLRPLPLRMSLPHRMPTVCREPAKPVRWLASSYFDDLKFAHGDQ